MSAVKVHEIVAICLKCFDVTAKEVCSSHVSKNTDPAASPVMALGAAVYMARRHTRATYYNIADSLLKGTEKPYDISRVVGRENEFKRRLGWSLRLARVAEAIESEIDDVHERRQDAKDRTIESLQAIAASPLRSTRGR